MEPICLTVSSSVFSISTTGSVAFLKSWLTFCINAVLLRSLTPKMPEMLPIWEGLGAKHKRFHKFGADVVNAINSSDYFRAEQLYRDAEHYSKELLSGCQARCGAR